MLHLFVMLVIVHLGYCGIVLNYFIITVQSVQRPLSMLSSCTEINLKILAKSKAGVQKSILLLL